MNKSKMLKIIIIGVIIFVIIGVIFTLILNKRKENYEDSNINQEYTPAEEITNEQIRQTIVTLYYNHKETNTLMPEARLIDAKLLADNPYVTLVNLLISEPKNDKLQSCIPEGTVLRGAELNNDLVVLNFSNEFITNHTGGEEKEKQTIDAIVNTLTELNEVKGVKILIEGEENKGFEDGAISFEKNFLRD